MHNFWTNHSGIIIFRMKNRRMELIGIYDSSVDAIHPFKALPCLQSTNRSFFEAPYSIGYICKDDAFDENGKVKIRVRDNYECEVLKLNRTFAEKYHLHNDSSKHISVDYAKDTSMTLGIGLIFICYMHY